MKLQPLLKNEWFKNSQTVHTYIYLLAKADGEGKLSTSISQICDATGLSPRSVRTALRTLEATKKTTNKATNKGTLITIVDKSVFEFDARTIDKQNDKQIDTAKILRIEPNVPPKVDKFPFMEWWNLYDKKIGKPNCLKIWEKLTDGVKETIMGHTRRYVASTPDKQYRKHPLTYLHQQSWEDEIISEKKTGWQTYTADTDYSAERAIMEEWNQH